MIKNNVFYLIMLTEHQSLPTVLSMHKISVMTLKWPIIVLDTYECSVEEPSSSGAHSELWHFS